MAPARDRRGGEAIVCEARLVEGLTDQEVRALFDRARDEDYEELAKELAPSPRRLATIRCPSGARRRRRSSRA